MTENFNAFVALNQRTVLIKMLLHWKNSIWQKLWLDIVVYLVLNITISLLYRYVFSPDPDLKRLFDDFVTYVQMIASIVPITFLLGFFVSTVLSRWWSFVRSIPWLSSPSFYVNTYMITDDLEKREHIYKMRKQVLRYLNLAWILQMVKNSHKIRCRFKPRKDDLQRICREKPKRIGFEEMLNNINKDPVVRETYGELVAKEEIYVFALRARDSDNPEGYEPEYWMPLTWCTHVIRDARRISLVEDSLFYSNLIKMVNNFRGSLGGVSVHNQFNIPLVYTQVIIIVVYAFYVSQLFTDQYTSKSTLTNATRFEQALDVLRTFVPFMGLLRFLLYMGWFRVGLSLVNPLREDQSGFPMNTILDYNLRASLEIGLFKTAYIPSTVTSNTYEGSDEFVQKDYTLTGVDTEKTSKPMKHDF